MGIDQKLWTSRVTTIPGDYKGLPSTTTEFGGDFPEALQSLSAAEAARRVKARWKPHFSHDLP